MSRNAILISVVEDRGGNVTTDLWRWLLVTSWLQISKNPIRMWKLYLAVCCDLHESPKFTCSQKSIPSNLFFEISHLFLSFTNNVSISVVHIAKASLIVFISHSLLADRWTFSCFPPSNVNRMIVFWHDANFRCPTKFSGNYLTCRVTSATVSLATC